MEGRWLEDLDKLVEMLMNHLGEDQLEESKLKCVIQYPLPCLPHSTSLEQFHSPRNCFGGG